MTTPQEQAEQLRKAFENGIIDENTYKTAIATVNIQDSQVGVIGDNATINGGINFYGGREDPKGLFRRYLTDLATATNRLPWGRLSPEKAGPDADESLRLSDVYTALDTVEPEKMECEDDIRHCLGQRENRRVSVLKMLDGNERLVLLGDPGSGKSTVVNFITHVMALSGFAKDAAEALARLGDETEWRHGALLPIRVILREFAAWRQTRNGGDGGLQAWIIHCLEKDKLDDLWREIHERLQEKDTPCLVFLDGLDEVPAADRKAMIDEIQSFSSRYENNRYVVTCRIYAYVDPAFRLPGFRRAILSSFSEEQVKGFIHAWYTELAAKGNLSVSEADSLANDLTAAVARPDLLEMAERPLIMTIMALLHTSYGRLPGDRVELYQWAVDLLFRRWEGRFGEGEQGLLASLDMPTLKMNDLTAGLYHAAFLAHEGQGAKGGTADIPEETLVKWLRPYLGNDWNRADRFIRYVRERSGLLIRHKPEAYTFPHRTFQEFMAACHLTGLKDYPREAARLARENPDLWYTVFILAAGHAGRTQLGNAISSVSKLCVRAVEAAPSPGAVDFQRAMIASRALVEIGLAAVEREEDGKEVLERCRQWLRHALSADGVLPALERVTAGNALSELGDPRFHGPERWYLPGEEDYGFLHISAGSFMMGSDKKVDSEAHGDEQPRHRVTLSEFWIGKYPVTVEQYRVFTEATKRELDESWRRSNRVGNHPVVIVSWHDAVAYCEWLTERLNEVGFIGRIALPTEAQWERAARGDGSEYRAYPWGAEADTEKMNFGETGIGGTSPVGCFPGGEAESGALDMAGNVDEWCLDSKREYSAQDVHDPQGEGAGRVIRGGAWDDSARDCRAAYRSRLVPDLRFSILGFRLARLPGQ